MYSTDGIEGKKMGRIAGVGPKLAESNAARVLAKPMPLRDRPEIPSFVHEILRQEGVPLAESAKRIYEPAFGHDFSKVRIHSDSMAARSAADVGARAYTVGNHVVLGSAAVDPKRQSRDFLLAHELAHTIQQSSPSTGLEFGITAPSDARERSADAAASQVLGGSRGVASSLQPGPMSLMRQAVDVSKDAPPARVPLADSLQATAYAFTAGDDWTAGSQTAKVDFTPQMVQGKAAGFPPVKLPIEAGKRAILQIVVTLNGQSSQSFTWRCDTDKGSITRLDSLGALTLSTGNDRDAVLGPLQGIATALPSTTPSLQVVAVIGGTTTSVTHTPQYWQEQGGLGGGVTSGAGSGGSATGGGTLTFGLQRTPAIDQTQRAPTAPSAVASFTVDLQLTNATQPAGPSVPDLVYLVHFANDSHAISSDEITKLLGWAHSVLPMYSGLRDAIRTGQVRIETTGRASTRGKDAAHNFTLSQQRNDAVRIALQGAASATGGARTTGGVLGGESLQIDADADGDFHDPKPADIDLDRVVQIFIRGSDATAALTKLASPGGAGK